MHLLDQEIPGLADVLQNLTLEQRRRAIAKVCLALSQFIMNLEPEIENLLRVALKENALSASQIGEARAYAEMADDRYLTLQEQNADKAEWDNWFSKARLGTAIAKAFDGRSWQDTARAAYELCFICEDKQACISAIRSEIESEVQGE